MLSSLTCSTPVPRNTNIPAQIAPATTSVHTGPKTRLPGLLRSLQAIAASAIRASAPVTYSTQRATAYAADSIVVIPLRPGAPTLVSSQPWTSWQEWDVADRDDGDGNQGGQCSVVDDGDHIGRCHWPGAAISQGPGRTRQRGQRASGPAPYCPRSAA